MEVNKKIIYNNIKANCRNIVTKRIKKKNCIICENYYYENFYDGKIHSINK